MIRIKTMAYALILMFGLASCGVITKDKSFSADRISLELNMDDLAFLGETEISVEYNTVLGVFTKLEKINGKNYDPGMPKKKLSLPVQGLIPNGVGIDMAAYKLKEQFPKADYYQVVSESTVKDRMFLGSVTQKTLRVKAYRFK